MGCVQRHYFEMDKDCDARGCCRYHRIKTAHSTRAASTGKARSCNVSMPAVMKAASWSSDCVFKTFYNKPVQTQNLAGGFSHAILSVAMETHWLFTLLAGKFLVLYNELSFDVLGDHMTLKSHGISSVDDWQNEWIKRDLPGSWNLIGILSGIYSSEITRPPIANWIPPCFLLCCVLLSWGLVRSLLLEGWPTVRISCNLFSVDAW